jgi:hypothetical protein
MQIRKISREDTYSIEDFEKSRFPVPYNEGYFPNGFTRIKVCYKDGDVSGVSLHGVHNSMKVKKTDIEKVLVLIRNSLVDMM